MGSSRVLVGKEIEACVELAVAGEIGEGERRVIVDNVEAIVAELKRNWESERDVLGNRRDRRRYQE